MLVSMFEPLPEHDESHAGPYGVEVPLHWDFVVEATKVTTAVRAGPDEKGCTGPAHSDEGGAKPKQT